MTEPSETPSPTPSAPSARPPRQSRLLASVVAICVVLLAGAGYFVWTAQTERRSAEAGLQRAEAERQRAEAGQQQAEAERQRQEADRRRAETSLDQALALAGPMMIDLAAGHRAGKAHMAMT